VIALVAAGYLVYRFVLFPPSDRISAEELAALQSLEPRLPEMLVTQADALSVAGEARDCRGEPGAVSSHQEAAGVRGETAWCAASGAYVASWVVLPRDGDEPVRLAAEALEMRSGSPGGAASMAREIAGELQLIEGSAQFIEVAGTGALSGTLRFRAQYPNRVQVFDCYYVRLLENWVAAGVTVVLRGRRATTRPPRQSPRRYTTEL
jgi:hypothetical protein